MERVLGALERSRMAKETRKATLDDLRSDGALHEYEVTTPSGERLLFEMRALTPDEALDALRIVGEPPEAPYTDEFFTDPDGKVTRKRDFRDPGYLHALQRYRMRQMHAQILACWAIDVPGETVDERLEYIAGLDNWAVSALWKITNQLIETAEEDIRHRPFRRA